MPKLRLFLALPLIALAAPTIAATPPDRATAVSTLAGFFNSADICNLFISRAKVQAYADGARPADDAMFNVDVFRATQDLYKSQKDWTKEQTDAYCKTAADTARTLGVNLN